MVACALALVPASATADAGDTSSEIASGAGTDPLLDYLEQGYAFRVSLPTPDVAHPPLARREPLDARRATQRPVLAQALQGNERAEVATSRCDADTRPHSSSASPDGVAITENDLAYGDRKVTALRGEPVTDARKATEATVPRVRAHGLVSANSKSADKKTVTDVPVPKEQRWIADLVKRLAPQYNIDPRLALAVISAESGFDTKARSPRNAQGLMQLIPETAERFQVVNPENPVQNLRGGLAYLRWLFSYFRGDVTLALAAYNAGEGTVARYRGVPPYPETQEYVRKILATFGQQSHPYDPSITPPSPSIRFVRNRQLEG